MENNNLSLPANYMTITEDECTYLDGGAQITTIATSVVTSIVSGTAAFFQVIGDSLKSCARSFVEVTLDDLRNPNFWAAVALTGALAAIGFGASYAEKKKAK